MILQQSIASKTTQDEALEVRSSATYQPSLWDHHYLLSLHNPFSQKESKVEERAALLKEEVRKMLNIEVEGSLEQLELIDFLDRLGVSHHFQTQIDHILSKTYHTSSKNDSNSGKIEDLHATALEFRLLRQYGFCVSQDVFDFMKRPKEGTFRRGLKEDVKGLLSLYEASYLSTEMDTKTKEARCYAKEGLREFISKNGNEMDEEEELHMKEMAMHALEMPYHWRMRRLEARWYIDMSNNTYHMKPLLLEFAKLDFNITQALHQHELKYLSSWWSNTGLKKQLPFARDRIAESYLASVGTICEAQFGYHRQILTKVFALITTIDDVYDIYGTMEELEVFTSAVQQWNVNNLNELPAYMRSCFLVLYNEVNLIGYDSLRDKNFNVIPYLKRAWTDLCKALLKEAKWSKSGYKPSLEEYMENGLVSSTVPTILIHLFCALSDSFSHIDVFDDLFHRHDHPITRCPSTILRLSNDLSTSSEEMGRGDVMKSVQCHMHETGASEEEARAHVRGMIASAWEELNLTLHKAAHSSSLPRGFVSAAANLGRTAQCVYQYGDGIGSPHNSDFVPRVRSLLFIPIHLS